MLFPSLQAQQQLAAWLSTPPPIIQNKSPTPTNALIPTILHTRQFTQENTGVYNFQCNCACPDDGFSFSAPRSWADYETPLMQPTLHGQFLPDDHLLLFNPYHDQGVTVLNETAVALWQQFQQPHRVDEILDRRTDGVGLTAIENMVALGALQPVGFQPQGRKRDPRVLNTWIHVTNECNLRCDYCYINKTNDDMPEAIGRATVEAILRSAQRHGFQQVKLKFAGGEATLNLKRVFDIHAYAIEQAQSKGIGIDTVVLSNGVAIGERAIEAFAERGIQVSISLDGIEEDHDAQRPFKNGRGSFAWVNRTLERLVNRGIKPFISITLSNRNAAGLAKLILYVFDRDLPFNINFFRENDCAAPHTDLKLRDDKIIGAMQDAFAVLEANLPDRCLLGSLVDRAQFDAPHDKTCSVGDSYLVIDHLGNVAKCQMEIERPITSIYADDPLGELRRDRLGIQNLPVDEKEGCRTCEWKYWCAGGCPVLTYRTTGRYDVKSPNCRIYKALYPQLLRLEGLRLLKLAAQQRTALTLPN
ncbi:MAG: radical SAM protein [Caldilineaceae bacterium]